ncbi:ASCH domain-containing protein [Thermodesulfovibrio aggregans]|uniref:ASCH domain-containing protein n=1 Tax=Thermodesulfovibrio aggregans TaxID=86166 RepID=UPI0007441793|nr:ASCH domain-containing protein [Thermodesulfovibrio aggregans]
MKALVIKQPWANQILSGEKTIEYRSWNTKYRGDILIVSEGQAIGIMTISDVRYNRQSGMYEWVISSVRRIKPFSVRGRLGLFEVPYHPHTDYQTNQEHR